MELPALVSQSCSSSEESEEQVSRLDISEYDGTARADRWTPSLDSHPVPERKLPPTTRPGVDPSAAPTIPDLIQVSDSDYDSDASDDHVPLPPTIASNATPAAPPQPPPSPLDPANPASIQTGPIHENGDESSSDADSDMPGLISQSDDDSDTSVSVSDFWDSSSDDDEPPARRLDIAVQPTPSPARPPTPSPVSYPGPKSPPIDLASDSDSDVPDLVPVSDSESPDEYDSDSASDCDDDHGEPFTRDSGIPDGFPLPVIQELVDLRSTPVSTSRSSTPVDYTILSGSVDNTWLAQPLTHAGIAERASSAIRAVRPTRRQTRAVLSADGNLPSNGFRPWPRRSSDPPSPQPPRVTKELIEEIAAQDLGCNPDAPYPPALSRFVSSLEEWRRKLTEHFNFDSSSYAANTRAAADRIAQRLSFLPKERFDKVMDIVRNGYTVPFSKTPPRFHRHSNSPDLSSHMHAAWEALRKDIGHGAVLPCDLKRDGKPWVVSPVRTAPKGWRTGKRRFVINMRFLNRHIPDQESACSLDTLSRIRNLLTFPGSHSSPAWGITMDLASGYHNFWVARHQWKYMGFALHRSELPVEAIEFLRSLAPECEDNESGNFYFLMRALGFGLAPSCAVFSLVVTSLAASWRRHTICGNPLRLTSYIDDFFALARTIREAIIASIELLYEATAAGLTINVGKCRLGPATLVKYLGTLIDLRRRLFRLPHSRVERIGVQIKEIRQQLTHSSHVPAKWVAQLVGLLWSISPCCHRAVSIMARGLIALLTAAMSSSVWKRPRANKSRFTLKRLLSAFWDGEVKWNTPADDDLSFWEIIEFADLRASISADTLEVMASSIRLHTSHFDHRNIAFLASDASETACGGGLLSYGAGSFDFDASGTFFSHLTSDILNASSGLREIVAIFWMLRSLESRLPRRVVVFTDSQVACSAISRGSRVYAIQFVARLIFAWCLRHSVCLFPCWAPRASDIISVADSRSRWSDTYGQQTPEGVFLAADRLAVRLWGAHLSFDRQASHLNAMPPRSLGLRPLPFNSLWNQPGSSGVDMFLQPPASWMANINFIHPAVPTVGRVLSFLPVTLARSVVVIPCRLVDDCPWWANFAARGSPGVLHTERVLGFLVVAVDHSC